MSSKTTSSQTSSNAFSQARQFDPAALAEYQRLQPQIGATLGQYMGDPLQSTFFQQNYGAGMRNISGNAATQMQGLFGNRGLSAGNMGAYQASQAGKISRGATTQSSDLFMGLLNNAEQARRWGTGQAAGYNPLETGESGTSSGRQDSTSTTGGLGTWLPQLIGAGIGAAGMAMSGGGTAALSLGKKAAMGSLGATMNASPFFRSQAPPQSYNGASGFFRPGNYGIPGGG